VTTAPSLDASLRVPLTRGRVLQAALRYIDEHGLEALSMHKLGAELGVRGMSLYNVVASKDDLLDGVVESLWAEIESAAPPETCWQQGYRALACAVRDVMHRHPKAAPLVTARRQVIPEPALRAVRAHVTAAMSSGVPEDAAYALLRTITSFALGYALVYVSWGLGESGCAPDVEDLLPPGTSEELANAAQMFCGQADVDAEFELGLDLMLRNVA
jgi:TetR/AcrR family tetracycline transcriptional repressor